VRPAGENHAAVPAPMRLVFIVRRRVASACGNARSAKSVALMHSKNRNRSPFATNRAIKDCSGRTGPFRSFASGVDHESRSFPTIFILSSWREAIVYRIKAAFICVSMSR
jgi:hypothetical protein